MLYMKLLWLEWLQFWTLGVERLWVEGCIHRVPKVVTVVYRLSWRAQRGGGSFHSLKKKKNPQKNFQA